MNKHAENLVLGAALAVMAYALYKHFKPATASATSTAAKPIFSVKNPLNPDIGVSYDATNPGYVSSLSDLLKGAVHDIGTGHGTPDIATTQDIISSTLGDIYGTDSGPSAQGSIISTAPSWLTDWQQAQE